MNNNNTTVSSPFFSIVVPVYNAESFLDDCIGSVLVQSFIDFEIVLVDDGSLDNSLSICKQYAMNDSRIRSYHKKNEGQLKTRVYGIAHSNGKYIICLDSDDMIRNDALQIIHDAAALYQTDLILFSGSRKSDYSDTWPELSLEPDKIINKEELYESICFGSTMNNMALKAFRREAVPDESFLGKYGFVRNGEDLIQSVHIIENCRSAVFIRQNLYYYRPNEKSTSNIYQPQFFESVKAVGSYLLQEASDWGNDYTWTKAIHSRNLVNCIDSVKYILDYCQSKDECVEHLKRITDDSFFNDSVENGDPARLSIKNKASLWFIKNRMFSTLYVLNRIRWKK